MGCALQDVQSFQELQYMMMVLEDDAMRAEYEKIMMTDDERMRNKKLRKRKQERKQRRRWFPFPIPPTVREGGMESPSSK